MLLITANADELYNCVDSQGNKVITSSPQDGMKCAIGESDEGVSSPRIFPKSHKISSSKNVLDICADLSRDLDGINDEIKDLDQSSVELKREQLDIRQKSVANNWNQKREWDETKYIRDQQYKINKQLSILYEKKSFTTNDIRSYKCDEIERDLSKLNQQKNETNINRNRRFRNQ